MAAGLSDEVDGFGDGDGGGKAAGRGRALVGDQHPGSARRRAGGVNI
jgi:hypothetical protein